MFSRAKTVHFAGLYQLALNFGVSPKKAATRRFPNNVKKYTDF